MPIRQMLIQKFQTLKFPCPNQHLKQVCCLQLHRHVFVPQLNVPIQWLELWFRPNVVPPKHAHDQQ